VGWQNYGWHPSLKPDAKPSGDLPTQHVDEHFNRTLSAQVRATRPISIDLANQGLCAAFQFKL
jgi:hypothetical protein